jgi:hypothetical protein
VLIVDRKKKFFIGLGILTVIYAGAISLNLTHDDEKETRNNSKSEYSKEKVIEKIKSDYSSFTDKLKPWFSLFLPELELFKDMTSSEYCTIEKGSKNNDEAYILLNKEYAQCVIFVKKSDESARIASLIYEVTKNQSARGINVNMHRAKNLTAVPFRHELILSKSQIKTLPDQSNKKDKTAVLMFFLEGVDQSYFDFKNSDYKTSKKKSSLLEKFLSKESEEQVIFVKKDNKFELTAPEKGGMFVLKCSDCSNNSIKIRTAD